MLETTEATFTMTPPPWRLINGMALWQARKTPVTLTAMSAFQSSSLVSTTLPRMP
ncbi:MAG: hypothetical protein R3C69_16505 [Geminicoccaceae bacterium]